MSFNDSQIKAIKHHKGPMMVLAGPGSGKTLVITQRTKYLIEGYGVNPGNILVITFTKAAALEMEFRFRQLMGGRPPVTFGTFHSVFFRILKFAYGYTARDIIPEERRTGLLKQIISRMDMEIQDEGEFLSSINSEISYVKGEMLDLNHYYAKNCSEEQFKQIYLQYEEGLRQERLIDFDDMMVMCYELFTQRPDILSAWQQKYQYILVDETQDINRTQYEIVRMLARPEDNLFVVGDDDQSIYRFRGAKPEIMLGFGNDYESGEMVLLDCNYRSSADIVAASLRLIGNNKTRYQKEIKTVHPPSGCLFTKDFADQKQENEYIITEIKRLLATGCTYADLAILYRTNTDPRFLLEKLMEYNLPFRTKDRVPNLFDHWIFKNIRSYQLLAAGCRERGEFMQVCNRPKRYIGRDAFLEAEISFEGLKDYYQDKEWMIERIDQMEYDLQILASMSPYAAITYIRKGIGYEEYLKEYAEYRRMKLDDLLQVLDELAQSAAAFRTFDEWYGHIEDYSRELKQQAKNKGEEGEGITLMTMHGSKGLEYKAVFIIDAIEGVTPHHKAALPADVEEERRLFYVAMTRAKEKLYICSVKERYQKAAEPSRFIGEYLMDSQALIAGRKIRHLKYGEGLIRSSQDGKIKVFFPKVRREVVLDLSYCISKRIIQSVD